MRHLPDGVYELGSSADPGLETAWSTFVDQRDDASLYHTLAWRDFVEDLFGHGSAHLIHVRDGRVDGVFPVFDVSFPILGRKLVSVPYDAGWGGPLCSDEGSRTALLKHAVALSAARSARVIEIRPPYRIEDAEGMGLIESQPVVITQARIGGEDTWKRIHRGQRNAIRQARSKGLTVRPGADEADYRAFFQIYLRAMRDLAIPPYQWRYFEQVRRRLAPGGGARLLVVELDGKILGAGLLFCQGKTLIAKISAALPGTEKLKLYPALYGAIVDLCIEQGIELLSWGTTAPSQTGLITYKERWAGESRPLWVYQASASGTPPSIDRYYDQTNLARRAWKHLPIALTRVPGGILNRWFC